MIHWTVQGNTLVSGDDRLATSTMEYLTGKRIHWYIRDTKIISIGKYKNRLALFDTYFIPGGTYRQQGHKVFKCISVDSTNNALLTRSDTDLITVVSNKPYEWEIMS